MRLHRFYVNKPLGEELVVESAGEDKEIVHQWLHVFRYAAGDKVLLFSPFTPHQDFIYEISAISKQEIQLSYISSQPNTKSLPITLVMALVKKDTFETIVRQATELGVSKIIPVEAARSEKKNLNFERLFAIATEAAEQSGRGSVPDITPIHSLEEAFSKVSGISVVGSLRGKPLTNKLNGDVTLWVGPEGGWTEEEEKSFADKEFFLLSCADTVLKADTAAVALLSKII